MLAVVRGVFYVRHDMYRFEAMSWTASIFDILQHSACIEHAIFIARVANIIIHDTF